MYINKSLFTLRHCLTALGARGQPASHVPYRDSKLTCLLATSLGGNAHTVLLACLSPLAACHQDNLSTLHYASVAQRVQNKV